MRRALFFILLLLSLSASGQTVGKWRAGSAYELKGRVYVMAFFVSSDTDNWNKKDKAEMLAKLAEAEDWIKEQAGIYHIPLSFKLGMDGYDKDIKLPGINRGTASGKERVDWVSQGLKAQGYPKGPDYYKKVKAAQQCDNIQVIVFVNGKGTSYSMAFSSDMDKNLYFLEGSVMYQKYWDGANDIPASFAHEMLHVYGAWDLYKTFAQTQAVEDKARKQFPNSIMLRTAYKINTLSVDEITAWLIGWKDTAEEWYEDYRPARTKQK